MGTLRICISDFSADFKISIYNREMSGSPRKEEEISRLFSGMSLRDPSSEEEEEMSRLLSGMSLGPSSRVRAKDEEMSRLLRAPQIRKTRGKFGQPKLEIKKPNFSRKAAKPKRAIIPIKYKHTCPICDLPMESSDKLSDHIEKNHKNMYETPKETAFMKGLKDYYRGGRRGRTRKARRASRNLRRSSRRS